MTPARYEFVAPAAVLALVTSACAAAGEQSAESAPETTPAPTTSHAPDTTTTTVVEEMEGDATDDMGSPAVAPMPFLELQVAAEAVGNDGSARALAAGLDAALGLDGSIDSPAAQTFATLATVLQEHVYLAGMAIDTGLETGPDSEPSRRLSTPSTGTRSLCPRSSGRWWATRTATPFSACGDHIGFFVDYTLAEASADSGAKEQALLDLGSHGEAARAFFESLSGGVIDRATVRSGLGVHIDTLGQAIESLAAVDRG